MGSLAPPLTSPPAGRVAWHVVPIARAFATVVAVAWIVFATVVVLTRYLVLPHLSDYRTDLERIAGRALGETVRIGALDASWRALRPSLLLRDVVVVDGDGHETLRLPTARATLSWRSAVAMELRLASLEIDGARLVVRRDRDGQLFVAGSPIRREANADNRAAEWLLAQDAVRVRGATIVWRDQQPAAPDEGSTAAAAVRPDLTVTDVDLALVRSPRRHRAALRATPPAALGAPIDLRAVIDHPLLARRLSDPATWRGQVYLDVATADVLAWRAWLPLPATVDGGHGRARAWIAFERGDAPAGNFVRRLAERTGRPLPAVLDRIGDVTADLALDDVAVRWGAVQYAALASVDGRLSAHQDGRHESFAVRRMALQAHDVDPVPPTDFTLERTVGATPADEAGHATLGAIDLGVSAGLVPAMLLPPSIAGKLATLQPRGALERMDIRWTGPIATPATFQVDAAFSRASLAAQPPTAEAIRIASQDIVGPDGIARRPHPPFGQPGIANAAGTLLARRTAAAGADDAPRTTVAVHLDSHDATVTAPGLFDDPSLHLSHVAAKIDVDVHGRDLEVRVADGVVENPDLAGTVALTFRHGPASRGIGEDGGRGWVDVDARLSRGDVARVPRYLPTLIGPKVRSYLSRALLAGRVTDATFRMHGPLDRLNLRTMPGARAAPHPVPLAMALATVRDAPRRAAPARSDPPKPEKSLAADDAVFRVAVRVEGATFLYGPARDPADATADRASAPADSPEARGEASSQARSPANSQARGEARGDASAAETAAATGAPSPPWPAFEDVSADVVIDQAKLTVHGRSARVRGYRLTDIDVELPALADPSHVLRVTGRGDGPLQDLVRFVNDSPVSRWTRRVTETTTATGNAALALALDLPLARPRDTEAAGSLGFADNRIALNAAVPPVDALTGRVDFTDRGVAIDGLTGRALGGPLRVSAKDGGDGFVDVDIAGTVDIAALKAATGVDPAAMRTPIERVVAHFAGTTTYSVSARLRNRRAAGANVTGGAGAAAAGTPDIVVRSDLAGLAIDLPAPLTKSADEKWPLRVAVTHSGGGDDREPAREAIQASLADRIAVDIARQAGADGAMAVGSARYSVGSAATAATPASGMRIVLPMLDVDAWRDVARDLAPPPGPAGAADASGGSAGRLLPERIALDTALLRVAGRDFTHVSATAERLPSGWRGDIDADQVAGRLAYTDVAGAAPVNNGANDGGKNGIPPPARGRFVARLTHLTIPQADASAAHVDRALDAGRQQDFPAIDLVADRFELRGRALGRLEVVAANVGHGDGHEWQLEKLGLTMPEARFTATGAWDRRGADENTRLAFDIDAADVGALMDRFGLTRTIKNGTARLTGNAAWDGSPASIDFGSLAGRMRLEADKGQFLKADPGIAKLLNILSLQGLARRLTFDFNDVFAEGFAFDTVRADATVTHGIASTDDFTMRGVQATVSMSGTADLGHETTDLHVFVKPEINAGAASLGVAVVNPVIGLATFAAQYLFKDRISSALSFEYNVAGPWARPDVTKVDHNGKVTPVVPKKTAVAGDKLSAP